MEVGSQHAAYLRREVCCCSFLAVLGLSLLIVAFSALIKTDNLLNKFGCVPYIFSGRCVAAAP
jgi:hypothetical protein